MENWIRQQLETILQEDIIVFPAYSGTVKTGSGKEYFLKTGDESKAFACEAHGLDELIRAQSINVVRPVAHGDNFILTEFVHRGQADEDFFKSFGRELASIHRFRGESFGFYEDNFIGLNEQPNMATAEEKANWTVFYFNKRLLFQYKMAEKNRYVTEEMRSYFSKLENRIEAIIGNDDEHPALLHGDLWCGNFICNEQGKAMLIDPAVYYGNREAELAMTKLFGGFPASFYQAYQQEYPLQPGWEHREDIYKLYHVLNHLNLFGHGYLSEAEWILKKYAG